MTAAIAGDVAADGDGDLLDLLVLQGVPLPVPHPLEPALERALLLAAAAAPTGTCWSSRGCWRTGRASSG